MLLVSHALLVHQEHPADILIVDPRHPPSQLADSIRLGQMYQPGSMEGLWQGRMLVSGSSRLGIVQMTDSCSSYSFMRLLT